MMSFILNKSCKKAVIIMMLVLFHCSSSNVAAFFIENCGKSTFGVLSAARQNTMLLEDTNRASTTNHSQELRASHSVSPGRQLPPLIKDPQFTSFEEVECDISEVSDILAMSCSRSVNVRHLCQRLAQLGQKNARYSLKYKNFDTLVSKVEKEWNVDPPFFGLLEMAKKHVTTTVHVCADSWNLRPDERCRFRCCFLLQRQQIKQRASQ